MPTCGYIKVQPDGMKIKNANSAKKWDPVSRRMIDICLPPPPLPASITGVDLGLQYESLDGITPTWYFTVDWTISKSARVFVKLYRRDDIETDSEIFSAPVRAGRESIRIYVEETSGLYYAVITPVGGLGLSSPPRYFYFEVV